MNKQPPQSFYFRHGQVLPASGQDPEVTEEGYLGLEMVRSQLSMRKFSPAHLFSSTERRCIESLTYMWPGTPLTVLPMLHAYGTFDFVGVVGQGRWIPRDYAHHLLNEILGVSEDQPFAVCSHDSTATLIGLALCERYGTEVSWSGKTYPHNMTFTDSGSGILVWGGVYEFFKPPD